MSTRCTFNIAHPKDGQTGSIKILLHLKDHLRDPPKKHLRETKAGAYMETLNPRTEGRWLNDIDSNSLIDPIPFNKLYTLNSFRNIYKLYILNKGLIDTLISAR